jgi:hypothetical protein
LQYGPEARPIPPTTRSVVGAFADPGFDRRSGASSATPLSQRFGRTGLSGDLGTPPTEQSFHFKGRAARVSTNLVQTRLLLFAESENVIPAAFHASFSLLSPLTVSTCLSFFALLASSAIFLILEFSKPFSGPMMISSAPLRHAPCKSAAAGAAVGIAPIPLTLARTG